MATLYILTALAVLVCVLIFKKTYKNAWSHLPSPGLPLPFLGHLRILLINPKDPVNAAWDLYKKFSQNGLLFTKAFYFRTVLVGDFDTLKFLFNHPDVQARTGANFHTDTLTKMMKEDRGSPSGPMEGVLLSQGKMWADQRRFTLRTLRDFGFGKSGMIMCRVN